MVTKNGKYAFVTVGASILYAVVIAATAWFLRNSDGLSQPVQVIVALVPIIPGALAVWAHTRSIHAMDEFLRKIQIDSLAIAAGGTVFLTISYGFLEIAGFPKLSTFYVAPLLVVIWVVSIFTQTFLRTRGTSRT